MKTNLEKIKAMLDSYQAAHGTVCVRSHENVNECQPCYGSSSACSGTCKGYCTSVCMATSNRY